jgi:hypothetical protein
MYMLHMEHAVPDYARWRAAFDGDPLGRTASGVKRYRVGRRIDTPDVVSIDLEFGTRDEAERMAGALRNMWIGAQKNGLIGVPSLSPIEVTDTVDL